MLSFLKSLLGKTPTTDEVREQLKEESVLPADDAEPAQQIGEDSKVTTSLSLHESWEERVSAQERYALSFMAEELPPLPKGTISIVGMSLVPHDEGIEVTAFVRNNTERPLRLGTIPLVILFGEQQLFTRQSFDLSVLGEIPPHSARPWSFVFAREHFIQVNVLLTDWKIAFETAEKKLSLPLELEESWVQSLGDQEKQMLTELAERLPAVKAGEVNIHSVQARKMEDGALHVILLIRNGSARSINFDKLPLEIYDADDDKVAHGLFELGTFIVNSGTSKPWLFIFPKESIQKEDADLSRWKAIVPLGKEQKA
ncbi:accessory Sec system S-layer assembly protein [Brevibacillus sp. TJ4]|uniref:accessory Sec system S-layer assembly protein n=1 Tax=Brevibacillus sp. TJ4 TaxID=3234853 RepID=UPI0037D422F2